MRHPLLPITAAFAAGVWATPHFYLSAPEQLRLLGVMVLGAALLLRFGYPSHGLILSLAGFFLCGTFLAAAEHSFLPPQHIESLARRGLFDPQQPAQLTGWARSPIVKQPRNEYFDLQLSQVEQGGRKLPAQGIVRIYYFADRQRPQPLNLDYGVRLSLPVADLRRPRNFRNPGFYDFEAYQKRRGIYFTGLIRQPEEMQRLPGRGGSLWVSLLHRLRGRLLANLDRLYPSEADPSDRAATLKAMLLGDDDWLRPETESAMQSSGTYHVLVVSGLHVGALALGLFWLFARLRLPNWATTLLVSFGLVSFAWLAAARIPVVRATLMALIYLAARLIYRNRPLLNSIAAAALILLILHPSDLRDSGFQLSFLAVLVLATIAVPVMQWTVSPYRLALRELEDREIDLHLEPRQAQFRHDMRVLLDYLCDPSRLARKRWRALRFALQKTASGMLLLAEAAVITFFTQIGFSLLMALYFHRVAWSGIAANLVIISLTPVLITVGFLVLMASLVWWPAAWLGGQALGALVFLLHGTAAWFAHLAWLNRRVPPPPLWVSLSFLAVLVVTAVLVARRSRWVWISAAVLLGSGGVLTFAPYSARLPRGILEVTALDVGHGDSLFVTFPGGSTMLMDGGGVIPIPGLPPSSLNIGESVVSSYLWSRRLKAVDYVVLTHAHWDHLGGLLTVLENFSVGELWVGPGPPGNAREGLLRLASQRGVRVVQQHSKLRREIDGVEVRVLSPPADWNPPQVSNNDSLVLRLGYGRRHVLLAGDIESRMEARLLDQGLPLASDILKVAHHGSRTSTTATFLQKVAPSFAAISVGPYRRFGHPHEEVLETLRRAGVRTYRTDTDGTVTARTNGNRIEITTFRQTARPWPAFPLL